MVIANRTEVQQRFVACFMLVVGRAIAIKSSTFAVVYFALMMGKNVFMQVG